MIAGRLLLFDSILWRFRYSYSLLSTTIHARIFKHGGGLVVLEKNFHALKRYAHTFTSTFSIFSGLGTAFVDENPGTIY